MLALRGKRGAKLNGYVLRKSAEQVGVCTCKSRLFTKAIE